MIVCEDVSKRLGTRRVLDGVSTALAAGEVLGLVGPNGAGKSTLLRVLAAETAADSGRVMLDGRRIEELPPAVLARTRAMLPQDVEVAFDFSVHELVLLGRTPHAVTETAACVAMADRCLGVVGLGEQAHLPVRALSGGERQRAHLARVLAQVGLGETGRYLLLDEPVSSQDPAWQLQILERLRELAKGGLGVAVVLHDLNLASRFCDRLLVLHAGRAASDGPPREVLRPQLLREVFGAEAHVDEHPFDGGPPRVAFRRL